MSKAGAQASPQAIASARLAELRAGGPSAVALRRAQQELAEARLELARCSQALGATGSQLDAVLESSPDALVVLDLDFRVVAHNRRYVALWQFPPELVAQRDGAALTRFAALQLRDPVTFQQRVADLRARPGAELFDTFELRDGRSFERYVSPQRIGARCVGTVVAWRDITERRQAEALRVAKDAAESANRSKSAFVSRMSHELRTPLNAILGFSDVLLMDTGQPLAPGQQQHVERIRTAGHHLLLLIEDVLDISRLDSGTMAVRVEAVDARASVHDAVRSMQVLADLRGVAMDVQVPPGPPGPCTVSADRTRLQQVLLNLLSNAIKYNRPAGAVTVRLLPQGARLRIEVEDTGLGLDALQQRDLFQPFNRLGREGGPVPGTGIGLAISRKLVELMGGTLGVASQPGVGSVFGFDLACQSAHAPRIEASATPQAPLPALRRDDVFGDVLYIDDDEVNRLLMQALLAFRPGVTLRLAGDGTTGMAEAQRRRPDLLLADMRLPDMTGVQVLQALRATPSCRGLPSLAVSANAMPDEVAQALRGGFDGYVTKPIDIDRLLAEVDRLLQRRA